MVLVGHASPVTDPAGPSIAMSMRFLFALYIVVTDGTTTPAGLTVADRLKITPSAVTVLAVTLLRPAVKAPSPGETAAVRYYTAQLQCYDHAWLRHELDIGCCY